VQGTPGRSRRDPADPFATEAYSYHLPARLIAQYPVEPRDSARLLVLDRHREELQHVRFRDLPRFLRPGDSLVLNESRVLPARLFARKPTGGRVEILLVEPLEEGRWWALLRASRLPEPGTRLELPGGWEAVLEARDAEGGRYRVALRGPGSLRELLERHGHVPLPPYIRRPDAPEDRRWYQTVYARAEGSVAAPTAGLHFTPELLERLREMGVGLARVVLHVGPGTFRPVKTSDLRQHRMHEEPYEVPEETVRELAETRRRGGRVVCVGTTAVRTLEAAAGPDGLPRAGKGRTNLYIYPPYEFKAVDALITNFHLPRSTLLMLVCAFGGRERVLRAYEEAVRLGYRFYSYGDAMLIL
jgi:S-adenosylmethionine:tRNA ribosyltransferase-isomerase